MSNVLNGSRKIRERIKGASEMEEMKNWADVRWQGYARKNGSKGIRNRILVIYTVKCSEFVARQIA